MKSIGDIIADIQENDGGKYLKHEWQLYAYRLALWLEDTERISMYMKLAKEEDRVLVEQAWDFVKDANARSKPKLFLWKVGQLRKERKEKEKKGKAEGAETGSNKGAQFAPQSKDKKPGVSRSNAPDAGAFGSETSMSKVGKKTANNKKYKKN